MRDRLPADANDTGRLFEVWLKRPSGLTRLATFATRSEALTEKRNLTAAKRARHDVGAYYIDWRWRSS